MTNTPNLGLNMATYQEHDDSTATSEGKEYQLNVLFEITDGRKITKMNVSDLEWILEHTTVVEERLKTADTSKPLLIYWSRQRKTWVTLDGAHRLTKAVKNGDKTIGCRIVSEDDLEKALIGKKKTKTALAKESLPAWAKW